MDDDNNLEDSVNLEENVTEEEPEGIAMELLHDLNENNKKIIEILKTTIRSFAISIVLIISIFLGVFLYFIHNFEFESYTQDGKGYNNINTGKQGDVINGRNT